MPANSFGEIFKLTTYGESHGEAIGGIITGCPAGLNLDIKQIQHELDRRKPGQSAITTQRKESDTVALLSGIFEGKTTGMPIAFTIPNNDYRPGDYNHLKEVIRPSHADYTYRKKYGIHDYRGGGRSSARETASWVVAGAVAKQFLALQNIQIRAYVESVGEITLTKIIDFADIPKAEENSVRCPDKVVAETMIGAIETAKKEGDTLGGIIHCSVMNVPVGLGEPVFDKLPALLGHAMLSINAVKGFEIGSGFDGTRMNGSKHNDLFVNEGGRIGTKTNHAGGTLGGISNGQPIAFRVAFKPVATLMQKQNTLDTDGNPVELDGRGRHDPCVVPRAVPIVEAMTAIVLMDMVLRGRNSE